ncbi:MAG: short-chain fatty acyl-CoA regulator family protein [Pseudomonadota bacterium]
MAKTFIGPTLRRLRQERGQTQAEMAAALGLSTSYVNLLENNQRSLSVSVLTSIADVYGIDWKELTGDSATERLGALRSALKDPVFAGAGPDLQECRAALDHTPRLVEQFLTLFGAHQSALDRVMKLSTTIGREDLIQSSPEATIHDYFRSCGNYFPDLEVAAERCRAVRSSLPEDHFATLKSRLREDHGIAVEVLSIDRMRDAIRLYDRDQRVIRLSQALDEPNRNFQLAHVLGLVECRDLLDAMIARSPIGDGGVGARLRIELANYFAAAYLMPYQRVFETAEASRYDLDQIATAFAVSFEQVCQRLTTLHRDGARGVPFFFLRMDRAGNVTKRFNASAVTLAEFGGSCPVWNVHTAFSSPGVILPQFVELPDGSQYFTVSRTVHRPVFSWDTQDRRLTLALGCDVRHAGRIGYASKFNLEDVSLFAPIGINCQLCQRQACTQRAHQPVFMDLPLDANRRGSTRYES